ncbi:4104_t:CDS:2, partial [Dentiscutata erythropus]
RLLEELESKKDEFLSHILFHCMRYQYSFSLIENIDETSLVFDISNTFTVEETSAHTVGIHTTRYKKSNFIVILCCLADGIVVQANKEGYMNFDEIVFWIERIWAR